MTEDPQLNSKPAQPQSVAGTLSSLVIILLGIGLCFLSLIAYGLSGNPWAGKPPFVLIWFLIIIGVSMIIGGIKSLIK